MDLVNGNLVGHTPSGEARVFTTGTQVIGDENLPTQTRYLAVRMDEETMYSTGMPITVSDARTLLDRKRSPCWQLHGTGNISQIPRKLAS